jgi:hypothetical protein
MWRPRSFPEPGGGHWSRGDTWRPQSCHEPGGGCRSPGDTWRPRSCPEPGGGSQSRSRSKTGFRVVLDRLVLTAATRSPTPSPIPSSAHAALTDPHWRAAIEEEYGALISNGTWELVPRPQGSNVVTDKWCFTHKLRADWTLDHYRAHWVLQRFTQCPGSTTMRPSARL